MSFVNLSSPSFCSQSSFAPVVSAPKSRSEILKEKTHEKAKEAMNKPNEEKTVEDYLNIGMDTINNLVDNAPVEHANSPQKLNYVV